MKFLFPLLLVLFAGTSFAQTTTILGPLQAQNNLSEYAGHPAAQSAVRTNLGIIIGTTTGTFADGGALATTAAQASAALPANRLGIANGAAALDSTGKLPAAQLPSTAVTSSQIGAANGAASLDSTGHLATGQIPITVITSSQVGAASGVAQLDSTVRLPATELPTTALTSSLLGAASGIAQLDSTGKLPAAQLPTAALISSELGTANGPASLDSTGHLTAAQIPSTVATTSQLSTLQPAIPAASGSLLAGPTTAGGAPVPVTPGTGLCDCWWRTERPAWHHRRHRFRWRPRCGGCQHCQHRAFCRQRGATGQPSRCGERCCSTRCHVTAAAIRIASYPLCQPANRHGGEYPCGRQR